MGYIECLWLYISQVETQKWRETGDAEEYQHDVWDAVSTSQVWIENTTRAPLYRWWVKFPRPLYDECNAMFAQSNTNLKWIIFAVLKRRSEKNNVQKLLKNINMSFCHEVCLSLPRGWNKSCTTQITFSIFLAKLYDLFPARQKPHLSVLWSKCRVETLLQVTTEDGVHERVWNLHCHTET